MDSDVAECHRKVTIGKNVAGTIRSLFNAEELLMPVLLYECETMIWTEKDRSRIRDVQMDNLRGLLGIRRKDRVKMGG